MSVGEHSSKAALNSETKKLHPNNGGDTPARLIWTCCPQFSIKIHEYLTDMFFHYIDPYGQQKTPVPHRVPTPTHSPLLMGAAMRWPRTPNQKWSQRAESWRHCSQSIVNPKYIKKYPCTLPLYPYNSYATLWISRATPYKPAGFRVTKSLFYYGIGRRMQIDYIRVRVTREQSSSIMARL